VDGLVVSNGLVIPAAELIWRFSPSGGPGGQHANTANTRAEVVWELGDSAVVTERQRRVLLQAFGAQVAVSADDSRSQARNRELALDRLAERIRAALRPEPKRRPTRPTRGSKERRLQSKRRRAEVKASRRRPRFD
jgi:ribosome-associated protein